MEWFNDFHNFSPLEESFFRVFSPQPQPPHPPQPSMEMQVMHQPQEENNLPPSPTLSFFDNINVGEVQARSKALVPRVEVLPVPVPDHPTEEAVQATNNDKGKKKEEKEKKAKVVKAKKTWQPRRRGVRWTDEEHMLFLMGLNKFGKGDWRSIARYYVISKTPTQVASHAQKYYRRLNSTTAPSRRRPSINDIHTVSQATPAASSSTITSANPSFPCFQHTYGVGAHVLERIPPPLMPPHNYKNLPSSCFFASLRNQRWG